MREMFSRYPSAGIGNFNPSQAVPTADLDGYSSVSRGELYCVINQIEKQPTKLILVCLKSAGRYTIQLEVYALFLGHDAHVVCNFVNDVAKIDRLPQHGHQAGIATAQKEQSFGEARKSLELFQLVFEDGSIVLRLPWHPQCNFGLGPKNRERRAELMRSVRSETPDFLERTFKSGDHAVECPS
jgi:hypothetical protein